MHVITWYLCGFRDGFLLGTYQHIHQFIVSLVKKKNETKVFCICEGKTGTNSVYKALSILGYRTVSMPYWKILHKGDVERFIDKLKACKYDAFSIYPMDHMDLYKKIDGKFPNSKFILTERDKESYAKSYENFHKNCPWKNITTESIKQKVEQFESYNKNVKEYFKHKPSQLLVINVYEGNKWEKLCKFLDKPIPKKPFPHKNKGRYKKK